MGCYPLQDYGLRLPSTATVLLLALKATKPGDGVAEPIMITALATS
jgi:hypothetical protein